MKRIKNLTMMALTLAIVVVCLMASTLTASASNIPRCVYECPCAGWVNLNDDNLCDRCGHDYPAHGGGGTIIYPNDTHTHTWRNANPDQYRSDPADPNKEQKKQVCAPCGAEQWVYYTTHSWTNFNPMQYQRKNETYHQYKQYCTRCGTSVTRWVDTGHSWDYNNNYQQKSLNQHQRQQVCRYCGDTRWVDQSHNYVYKDTYRQNGETKHQRQQICSYCDQVNWVDQNCSWVSYNPMVYQQSTNSQHQYKQYCRYCNNTKWVNQGHNMQAQNNTKITEENRDDNPYDAYKPLNDTQCERKYKCSTCGYVEWRPTSHSWNQATPYTNLNETQHSNTRSCKNCGFTKKEYQKQNHNFSEQWMGDYDGHTKVKMCNVCGYITDEGKNQEHTYGAWSTTTSKGVVTKKRTCSTCKYIDEDTEIIATVDPPEIADVVSPALTFGEINAAAGNTNGADWRVYVGSGSNYDATVAASANYVWKYGDRYYRLSTRPDGLKYITRLPTYWWSRINVSNPNANVKPGSGTTTSGSYTTNTNAPSGYQFGNTNTSYGQADSAIWNAAMANPNAPLTSHGGYSYIPVSPGYSGLTMPAPNGQTVAATRDPVTGALNPTLQSTQTYYSHSCSWAYSYNSMNESRHIKVGRSCCGGYRQTTENHNFGAWTYTDMGPDGHRAERICKKCAYVETKVVKHADTNNDHRCNNCGRTLSVDITWRWYDEHTPVVDTIKQMYYEGLVHPPMRGRMDYKFTGWYTRWGGSENGGEEWPHGRDYPYGSPTELFASWKAIVEIDFDLSAPIITVTRDPVDIDDPTSQVVLTITATDPEGNDHELPLQIEGETVWHASPYVITVDRSKEITIVARDTEDNTRQFVVDVNNVDTQPPTIEAITSNVQGWTKDPATLTVTATDDIKLHTTPYQWEFTPNSTGKEVLGQWTSIRTFTVAEAGKVRVQVRDAVGNATWSDYFYVNNVDTIAPDLNSTTPYTLDTEETVPASRGVTVTLNIQDVADPVTGLSSGLAPDPIKWPDETVFGKSITKTLYANGTYDVVLQDAVGNTRVVQVVISNISTNNPTINNFYAISEDGKTITGSASSNEWYRAPFTLVVDASFGAAGEDEKSYSWDGGLTWTSLNTHVVQTNGEYTVMIRDSVGTVVEKSIILDNTDATKPVVGMYLYKGLPEDWTDPNYIERDYVWKMRIEAEDLGSGIKSVHTQWDDKTYTADQLPIIFDVKTPGSYQVTVTDNAGNQVQAEKVAQWTDLGENVDGPNPNVPVIPPEYGTGGAAPNGNGSTTGSGLGPNGLDWGTAGYPFNANLEDLVFGPDGAYNTNTGEFIPYPAGMAGIPVNFNAHVTRNKWATAYVTFNGVKYPATFAPVPNPFNTSYSNGISPVKGTGDPLAGHAFIPISDITGDMKNARITVTVSEWNDASCTGTPNRVGTENFYTSAQMSKPVITYVYNQVTEELTISATSAIAGIEKIEYSLDGGTTWNRYDGTPVVLTGIDPTATIVLRATDKLGLSTDLTVSVADLGLNGGAGGGSLPADGNAEGLPEGTNSHHSSNRAADIYIIGGTRSNTTQVPNATVFGYLTGSTQSYAGN